MKSKWVLKFGNMSNETMAQVKAIEPEEWRGSVLTHNIPLDLATLFVKAPELVETLRELFQNCTMIHTYWGENCNQREADNAINKARALLAELGVKP